VRHEERSVGQKNPEREQKEETKQSRWGFRGMTVRDWLQLLIVPLALVVISFLFTTQQDQRQQRIENQRAEAERDLAEQRAQDEALQAYLDQMGSLLWRRICAPQRRAARCERWRGHGR
jgi:cell division protein FtsB